MAGSPPDRRPARGRFAPSPTGDLHLGTARTALCAWLQARAAGGALVLREEDLDSARVVPGAAERMREDLRWLGLDWDEGPDVGGACGPYLQSQRREGYREALRRLDVQGQIVRCFCTRAEVAARSASAPHVGEDGPRYPGTCRGLDDARRAELEATRPPSLRFRTEAGAVTFTDALHGPIVEDVAQSIGDFVICRADGVPAYQLAVVVDDIAMGITHVVRGDDLLSSTPRQLVLFAALGAPPPRYLHVPLVVDLDGVRLAKRHASLSVRALREGGRDAREVVGFLAATLGLCAAGTRARPAELVRHFDVARLRTEVARIDPTAVF
jgi:glutamyl-tRNA synthetase